MSLQKKHCPILNVPMNDYMRCSFVEYVDHWNYKTVIHQNQRFSLHEYPFFILRLPDEIVRLFEIDKSWIPSASSLGRTTATLAQQKHGIFQLFYEEEVMADNSELLEHIENMMPNQITPEEVDLYTSSSFFSDNNSYYYYEHQPFSIMDNAFQLFSKLNSGWNLNRLPNLLTTLLDTTKINGERLPVYGVTSSYSYFGEYGSYACMHNEDLAFRSANFLFPRSAVKIWTGFKDSELTKVNNALIDAKINECYDSLLHKNVLLSKEFYSDQKMLMIYGIQKPGDIIVTNGYHQVFNTGTNVAEAVNFFSYGTLPESSRYKICSHKEIAERYDNKRWKPYIDLLEYREREMWEGEKWMLQAKSDLKTLTAAAGSRQIKKQELKNERHNVPTGIEKTAEKSSSDSAEHTGTLCSVMETLNRLIEDSCSRLQPKIVEANSAGESAVSQIVTGRLSFSAEAAAETVPFKVISIPNSPSDLSLNESGNNKSAAEQVASTSESESKNSVAEPDSNVTVSPSNATVPELNETATVPGSNVAKSNPTFVEADENSTVPESNAAVRESINIYQPVQPVIRKRKPIKQLKIHKPEKTIRIESKNSSTGSGTEGQDDSGHDKKEKAAKAKELQERRQYYDKNKDSRRNASQKYESKRDQKDHARSARAQQFKDDMHTVHKRMETAKKYLRQHAVYARQTNKINVVKLKLQNDQELKEQMIRLQELYYALLHHFGQQKVDDRIVEGMNAYEIVRDFVQLSDNDTRTLFYENMIKKKIKNEEFWKNVLTNEAEWTKVFGIDKAFRIPCEDKKKT